MKNYIVAHYGGTRPTFTPAETLDAARLQALAVLTDRRNNPTDVVSIIDADTDEVLYYGKGKKLIAKLKGINQPAATGLLWSFKPVLHWMSLKLSNPATR